MSLSTETLAAVPILGESTAGPISKLDLEKVTMVGQVFRGEIRKLEMTKSGDLLVLAGLGLSLLRKDAMEFELLYPDQTFAWFGLSADALVVAVSVDEGMEFFRSTDFGALEAVEVENYNERMRSFGVSAAGDLALPGETEIEMWMADGENFFFPFPDRVDAKFSTVRMSQDGKYVSALAPNRFFGIWDTESGEAIFESARKTPSNSTFLSGDRILLQYTRTGPGPVSSSHQVRNLLDFDSERQPIPDSEGTFDFGYGRLVLTDRAGNCTTWDHETLKPDSDAPREAVKRQNPPPVIKTAVGRTSLATYHSKLGQLTVQRETELCFHGFHSQLRGVRSSVTGDHLAFTALIDHKAVVVDLAERQALVVDTEAMAPLCLALDAERMACESGRLGSPASLMALSARTEGFELHALPSLSRALILGRDSYAMAASFPDGGEVTVYTWGEKSPRVRMKADLGAARELKSGYESGRIGVSWAEGTTIFNLEDGTLLETLDACKALAVGSDDNLAWYDGSHLNLRYQQKTKQIAVERPERGVLRLCFSLDDSVLVLGTNKGILHFYCSESGDLLRTELGHSGDVVDLQQRCGLVYSLGGDSTLKIWGVPGGEKSPAPSEPTLSKVSTPGLKLKAKNRAWAHTKASQLSESLYLALQDGRSATFAEVSDDLEKSDLQANLEGTAWISCESENVFWIKEAQWEVAGDDIDLPAFQESLRLLHPVHLPEAEREQLKQKYPQQAQWQRDCHIPRDPEDTSVSPSSEGLVELSNERVLDLLKGVGFQAHRDSKKAQNAWLYQAPELGAIAIADLFETRGLLEIKFYAWNGRKDGGKCLSLGQVDPQFYSEVVQMVLECQ